MVDLPNANLFNERRDLIRLEALETISASKLTLKQAEELSALHEQYGLGYQRKLAAALVKLQVALDGPRFADSRGIPDPNIIGQQVEALSNYRLPERAGMLTPDQSRQVRVELANRLMTLAGLRRHALRNATTLKSQLSLAEDLWKGLTPADCEWKMKGGSAETLADLKAKTTQAEIVATSADSEYWNVKLMMETLTRIMDDWDRARGNDRPAPPPKSEDGI